MAKCEITRSGPGSPGKTFVSRSSLPASPARSRTEQEHPGHQTRPPRTDVLARLLAAPFALGNALSQQTRRQGVLTVVSWLESQAGDSWQERWAASGAEAAPDWRDLVASWRTGRIGGSGCPPHIGPGCSS
jgi:hypothetical protein